MSRSTLLLRRARKSIQNLDLLKALESELNHELSSIRFEDLEIGSVGDFVLEWDSPRSQDVLFRKKCLSGEEVVVSALLSHESFQGDGKYPREALMKICLKKSGLNSILHFDCVASSSADGKSDFDIQKAHCIPFSSYHQSLLYRGPAFSDLDDALQRELKQYLIARGIGENFTTFLLHHLHKKEQAQYVEWLHKLKDATSNEDTCSGAV